MLSDLITQDYAEKSESQTDYIQKAKVALLIIASILLLILSV